MSKLDNAVELSEIVNKSGFPLQLAIENLVAEKYTGWSILHKEHAWKNEADDSSGYIDLVLQHADGKSILVVECKRALDTAWLFLTTPSESGSRRQAKLWFSNRTDLRLLYSDWSDIALDPPSPQSAYCVSVGNNRETLEVTAAKLVSATEALAKEELEIFSKTSLALRMYASVIVTTAKLKLCQVDPRSISLENGKVSGATYSDASFVRFRKQLSCRHHDESSASDDSFGALAGSKERTVFVVNAESLELFLGSYHVDSNAPIGLGPRPRR